MKTKLSRALPVGLIMLGYALGSGLGAQGALAEDVADFYRGKTINLYVAYPPGGGYDIYSRVIARHMPKHIPGAPKMVVLNMPGAAGVKAANFLYSIAPRDGAAIGMIADNAVTEEIVRSPGIEYVTKNFAWLGRIMMSVNVTIVPPGSPIRSIEDLRERELIVGGTNAGGFTAVLHNVANSVGGTKFKTVYGYAASPETCLAMERGEVSGCTPSFTFVKATRREWLEPRKATVLMQWGMERHRELPQVPTMSEIGRTPDDRKILDLFASASEIGRSIVAPPGTPPERVQALRDAFMKAMNDSELLAEVQKANLDHDPLDGLALQKIVNEISDVTPDIAARAKRAHSGG